MLRLTAADWLLMMLTQLASSQGPGGRPAHGENRGATATWDGLRGVDAVESLSNSAVSNEGA